MKRNTQKGDHLCKLTELSPYYKRIAGPYININQITMKSLDFTVFWSHLKAVHVSSI